MKDRLPPDSQIVDEMQQLVAASLADRLSPAQGHRLEELIRENIDACDLYLNLIHDWSMLLDWAGAEQQNDAAMAGPLDTTMQSVESDAAVSGMKEEGCENLSASIPPSFFSLGNAFHGTIGYIASDWAQAYLIGILLTGMGLLIGSLISVRHYEQMAKKSSAPIAPAVAVQPLKMEYIGRITGMVDVRWSDSTTAAVTELVALGRRYALASGLMEITYDTGAKVILQGPCTYQADSRDGGFLAVGKLTARLEKKGSGGRGQGAEKVTGGQWSVASESDPKSRNPEISKSPISNPQSPIPNPSLSTIHYPLFTIKTPTAVVTDLGTEFGVEVKPNGRTTTNVFLGEVVVQPRNGSKKSVAQGIHLKAGQTAYIEADCAEASVPTTHSNKIPFARSMPLQTSRRIVLFEDDASRVARVFGFNEGDWTGEGWRLGGKKTFFVRCGMHSSVPPRAALMDTEDRCWAILPGTTAVRDFGCNLPIGGAFMIDLDPDRAPHSCSMGFGLGNSAEKWLFEFAIENGRKTYTIHDNMGDSSDTGIPHTDRGLHLELSRTSENSYWLSVVPLGDHRKFAFEGQFRDSSAGSDIRRLRLWNQDGTKPSKSEFYFNNIRVVMPQTR